MLFEVQITKGNLRHPSACTIALNPLPQAAMALCVITPSSEKIAGIAILRSRDQVFLELQQSAPFFLNTALVSM